MGLKSGDCLFEVWPLDRLWDCKVFLRINTLSLPIHLGSGITALCLSHVYEINNCEDLSHCSISVLKAILIVTECFCWAEQLKAAVVSGSAPQGQEKVKQWDACDSNLHTVLWNAIQQQF